ncbi:hypothetical protein ACFIOY_35780 [Bradyrhizobium sp. TZ2]|jgi:hypothetical protein
MEVMAAFRRHKTRFGSRTQKIGKLSRGQSYLSDPRILPVGALARSTIGFTLAVADLARVVAQHAQREVPIFETEATSL